MTDAGQMAPRSLPISSSSVILRLHIQGISAKETTHLGFETFIVSLFYPGRCTVPFVRSHLPVIVSIAQNVDPGQTKN